MGNAEYMGVHFIKTVLKLNTAFQSTTFKFKMKVLVVCLVGAALVGMVASTPLEKVKGETNVAGETIPISVEGEEAITPMDNEVLKEGQGVEGNCKFGGITADRGICIATCRKYGYRGYQYCANHKCWCAVHAGSCPC